MILTTGEQKVEHAEKDHPGQHAITPAKKAERPKSLPFHSRNVDPPVIRESPEFALGKVFGDQDKTAFIASLDSGSNNVRQLPGPSHSPKPRGASGGQDNSSQVRMIYRLYP